MLFGLGVVVVNRRRERRLSLERARPPTKPVEKPPPEVLEPEGAAPDLAEPGVVEEADVEVSEVEVEDAEVEDEVLAPPRFRDRLGKARARARWGICVGARREAASPKRHGTTSRRPCCGPTSGVSLTTDLIDDLRAQVKADGLTTPDEVLDALKADLFEQLDGVDRSLVLDPKPGEPCVWLFVGVNGVGKTTTIGKVGGTPDRRRAHRRDGRRRHVPCRRRRAARARGPTESVPTSCAEPRAATRAR